MSGLYPLTVNTDPSAEPHIYAEDDAAIYQSMFGSDGVCNIGQNCAATVISNNKVRVADGVICVGGHMARVRYGEYQDCEIMNGQTGYNRNDIIVAKFVTTGAQGTDTYTIEVVQGTAVAGDATDPALTQGDLYEGDKIRMMPLYRVKIEGLSIVAVEQLFEVIPTIPELQAQVTELNGKLNNTLTKASAYKGNIIFCPYVSNESYALFPLENAKNRVESVHVNELTIPDVVTCYDSNVERSFNDFGILFKVSETASRAAYLNMDIIWK